MPGRETRILAELRATMRVPLCSLESLTDDQFAAGIYQTLTAGTQTSTSKNTQRILACIEGRPPRPMNNADGAGCSLDLYAAVKWWWELAADYDPITVVMAMLNVSPPPKQRVLNGALWDLCSVEFSARNFRPKCGQRVCLQCQHSPCTCGCFASIQVVYHVVQEVLCRLIGLLIAAGAQRDYHPRCCWSATERSDAQKWAAQNVALLAAANANVPPTMLENLAQNRAGTAAIDTLLNYPVSNAKRAIAEYNRNNFCVTHSSLDGWLAFSDEQWRKWRKERQVHCIPRWDCDKERGGQLDGRLGPFRGKPHGRPF